MTISRISNILPHFLCASMWGPQLMLGIILNGSFFIFAEARAHNQTQCWLLWPVSLPASLRSHPHFLRLELPVDPHSHLAFS